ncbi:hypothetical protein OESDEN_07085 [Oesophagostomum dentatum]|uniref:HTH CENPB-type domain-containing protein n=1 Tax=Oesophagostomum dentatum TaxID=61180 RepID=A0A0B1T6Z1_OESDE|nr:hypothetical protein OESDEN_07085 [Oesophagostomum dentatum]
MTGQIICGNQYLIINELSFYLSFQVLQSYQALANLKDWTKQEAQLEAQLKPTSSNLSISSKRLQGAGSPLNDKDFDEKLINWIRQERLKKLHVSRTMLRKQALVFSNEAFKAKVRQFYEGWMLCGEKSYNNSDNVRAPSMEVYLKWMAGAWD